MVRLARWATVAVALAGCGPREASPEADEPAVVELAGELPLPRTLYGGHVYVVRGLYDLHAPLTIEPGAIVKFGPHGALWGHTGRIVAVGTEAEPIVFTALEDDVHGGDTNGDGAATTPVAGSSGSSYWMETRVDGSAFEHCRVLYGGSIFEAALVLDAATTLRDSVIAHNDVYGVAVEVARFGGGSVIASNVFFDNGTPLVLSASATVAGNVFHDPAASPPYDAVTGNWPNQVTLVPTDPWSDPVTATFAGATSLSVRDVAVVSTGDVVVPAGSGFTLVEGTVLKFRPGFRISLAEADGLVLGDGSLVTSWRDEANGPPVQGAEGASPAGGDWLGVWSEASGVWISDPRFLYSANSSAL